MARSKNLKAKIGAQLSGRDLAEFRRSLSALKRKGLIPGKVDARTARPLQVRGGKSLIEYVRKFRSVASGEAEAIELPRAAVIEQHKLGHKSFAGRVIVPKAHDEAVIFDKKSGQIHIVDTRSGVTRIDLPAKWLDKDTETVLKKIESETPGQKYWGYKFKDHRGFKVYENLPDLLRDIKKRYGKRVDDRELKDEDFYEYLSIITTNDWNKLEREDGNTGLIKKKAKTKAKAKKKPAKRKRK